MTLINKKHIKSFLCPFFIACAFGACATLQPITNDSDFRTDPHGQPYDPSKPSTPPIVIEGRIRI